MISRLISVLMFSNATVRGGAEEHILQLLKGLDRNLFLPSLACPNELADKLSPDLPTGVRLHRLMLDHITDVAGARHLGRILREEHIDILHSHMFRASLFASPIGWLCGVPVIVETSHGREVWRTGWIKSKFFIDRWASRFVDHLIAVSDATAKHLVETKGIAREKITVIRSAVDLGYFQPRHSAPAGLRERLGFGRNDPVLLVAGRLEPQKGHRVILDAMPLVLREFSNARLVCLSDGGLRPELEAQVVRLQISPSVRFVGRQPDVRDWWALADLSVLPSFYEGLPLSAIESLAMECPIVATAVDGTPEVVINEKTGLTVPPGDSKSLAAAICRMLREPARAKRMALAGREHVLAEFSVENLVQKTQQLYLRAWETRMGSAKGSDGHEFAKFASESKEPTLVSAAAKKN